MNKTPWTASRVIAAVLLILSVGSALLGLQWLVGGNQLLHTGSTDVSGLSSTAGFFLRLAGAALLIIGSILAVLFSWLYRRVTRRLKSTQASTLKASTSKAK